MISTTGQQGPPGSPRNGDEKNEGKMGEGGFSKHSPVEPTELPCSPDGLTAWPSVSAPIRSILVFTRQTRTFRQEPSSPSRAHKAEMSTRAAELTKTWTVEMLSSFCSWQPPPETDQLLSH